MSELEKFEELLKMGYKYDKDSGIFYGQKGNPIKRKNAQGYITLMNNTRAHRFGWYYIYGEIPNIIDHINRDRSDNRLENLRNVDRKTNNTNSKRFDDAKKYAFHKKSGKYTAQICIDYKKIHIGIYNTKEEAIQARIDYENRL